MREWSTLKKLIWYYAIKGAAGAIRKVTGTVPLVLQNALAEAIKSLTQYGLVTQPPKDYYDSLTQKGKCTQDGTPTPDAPVDIMCNNGAIKYGWHDIITTSQLNGYGTYVSPSQVAGNRAYRWLKDLPNGTYQLTVDGDYEIIVQWRDPADPIAYPITSVYENLTGWMTSGVVTLDKTSGGYGIAVRRTSGTDSIMPRNFDGTLHVQEQGIYTDGTPETLTVRGKNLYNPAASAVGKTLNDSGELVVLSDSGICRYTDLIPVKASTEYAFKLTRTEAGIFTRVCSYDSLGQFIALKYKSIDVTATTLTTTFTTEANAAYVRMSFKFDSTDVQLEVGSTPTEYEPYTAQTVTNLPMLLSVGDAKDEAEIIGGIKTGKVGVYVFTGDETFGTSTAYGKCILWNKQNHRLGADPTVAPLCTHYSGLVSPSGVQEENTCFFNSTGHFYFRVADNDTTAFKADLAARYASGNPVILLYALATETTEQTTAQHLTVSPNSEIIVVANVPDIETEIGHSEHTTPSPEYPLPLFCNNGELKWNGTRIVTEGTPEVLTVSCANLLNPATNITGKYITAGGSISNGDDAQYTDLIPVTAGEVYAWSLVSNRENGGQDRCHGYNSSGNWVRQIAAQTAGKGVGSPFFLLATIPDGVSYVRLSYGINDTEVMLSSSGSASENIAEGFFNGVYQNNVCCLPSNYESETIQSPHTSALSSRAPALLAKVEPGKKYYIRNKVNGEGRRSITYFASLDDVTDSNKSIYHIDATTNDIAYTKAPAGAAYVVIGFTSGKAETTYTFGDPDFVEVNADDYSPYVPQQTASVPMLLSVGDTKDYAEIISGLVNRKCGIAVLDGDNIKATSSDIVGGSYLRFYGFTLPSQMASGKAILCSHYRYNDGAFTGYEIRNVFGGCQIYDNSFIDQSGRVAAFNSFLASECAKGTPVIVIYALAEPTAESVTPQQLTLAEGTNTIDATANVSPIQLEAEYHAEA